ncbi:MAG: hypothetical protein JWR63_4300 [Conexibacter sp.]|nr:hypothetical protein [Conexibacter sp.]
MTHRLLALAALLAAGLALGAASASGAATATGLAPVAADSPTTAYDGWVVWSEPGADGLWRLVAYHGGVKRDLGAAPRAVPFDADLGPDAQGHVTVVFSRCATEPDFSSPQPWSTSRGCVLRAIDLTGGAERALRPPSLHGSDSTPSLFGTRLAFQRRARGADVSQLELYDVATHRTRTLRHGAVPHGCHVVGGCAKARFQGEVGELDLGTKTVAFSWHLAAPGVTGVGAAWEMRVEPTAGGRAVLAGNGYVSGACGARTPYSPNATATGLVFLSRWYHCEQVTGTVTSTTLGSGLLSRTDDVGGGVAWRIARDGATTYAVIGPEHRETQTPLPAGSLRLVRLNGVVPQPTGRRASEPFLTG